jgi:hypothetical protein
MNSRKNIQTELEQLNSSLPLNAKTPVFDLPQGYFENFASAVLAIVKDNTAESAPEELAALSPLLAGMSRQTPFALPENYFQENLVLPPVTADEELPAWMQQARTMPYAVPPDYFEHFSPAVLQQVAPQKEPARVISMFTRNWVRYAAAAVVTGALVLGGFLYSGSNAPGSSAQNQSWVEKNLRNVSSEELDDFIEVVGLAGTETALKKGGNRPEVRRMLQDVPVSELDAFLEQMPAGTEQLN